MCNPSLRKPLHVVLAASLASLAPDISAQAPSSINPERTNVSRTMTYAADAPQGRQALDWIRNLSPTRAPRFGTGGRVTITRMLRVAGPGAAQRAYAAMSELSPTSPPVSGLDVERYSVEHTLPDGSRESWVFEWRGGGGGGWSTVEYGYRDGSGGGSRPSPNPQIR